MTDSESKPSAVVKAEGVEEDTEAKKGQETETTEAKEMRAVVLSGFGGLKSVKIVKRAEPALADGEVLIRVHLW